MHVTNEGDGSRIFDMDFWAQAGAERSIEEQERELRKCTYAGRPFGEEAFVAEMEDRFQGNGGGPAREESGGFFNFGIKYSLRCPREF